MCNSQLKSYTHTIDTTQSARTAGMKRQAWGSRRACLVSLPVCTELGKTRVEILPLLAWLCSVPPSRHGGKPRTNEHLQTGCHSQVATPFHSSVKGLTTPCLLRTSRNVPSRQEFQLLYVQDPHGVLNSFLVIPEPKPDAWAQDQRQGLPALP